MLCCVLFQFASMIYLFFYTKIKLKSLLDEMLHCASRADCFFSQDSRLLISQSKNYILLILHIYFIYKEFFFLQRTSQNLGVGYNAPECTKPSAYTMKSDVYSFGVVMLELLTGRMPLDRYVTLFT